MHVLSVVFNQNMMIFRNLWFCVTKTDALEGTGHVVIMCKMSEKLKNASGRLILELSCESGVHSTRGTQPFFEGKHYVIFSCSNRVFSQPILLP